MSLINSVPGVLSLYQLLAILAPEVLCYHHHIHKNKTVVRPTSSFIILYRFTRQL